MAIIFTNEGFRRKTLTIAAAGTTSTPIILKNEGLRSLETPIGLTGTKLTLQSSPDGVTYRNMYSSNGQILSITIQVNAEIIFDGFDFAGIDYLRFVSNETEAAEREFKLITRVYPQ